MAQLESHLGMQVRYLVITPQLEWRATSACRSCHLPLTTYYSLLTAYYSLLSSTYYSLLTTHYSLLTSHLGMQPVPVEVSK